MSELCARIDRFAETTPDAPAVLSAGEAISYSEFAARTDALARRLVESGLGRGRLVDICMPRSASLLIAIVGVMKAGMTYLINEAGHPGGGPGIGADVRDSVAATLVLDATGEIQLARSDAGSCGPALRRKGRMAAPAYLLLTSGSTGARKGVMVTPRNIAHYCRGLRTRLGVTRPMHCGHVSSLEADLGNTSLFLAWWTGGAVCLASEAERRDPAAMAAWVRDSGLDLLKITPSHWQSVLSAFGAMEGVLLPLLVLGGEPLSFELARRTLSTGRVAQLWNHYGPTETTIGVAAYRVENVDLLAEQGHRTVLIGRPMGRTRFLLIDDLGAVREGQGTGELVVAGPAVSAGYLGDRDKAAGFVRIAGQAGVVYRTGDQVSIDAEGLVEFLGRRDRQVKLNGFRIDLDALEGRIREISGVSSVACWITGEPSRPRLEAAVRSARGECDADVLLRSLTAELGPRMAPTVLHVVEDWPLTGNGKTDYRRLADLGTPSREPASTSQVEAGDFVQAAIAIWSDQLGLPVVGATDDFFALGGDSLDAIKVIGRLQLAGFPVTAVQFLATPTIGALAEALQVADERARPPDAVATEAGLTVALEEWLRLPGLSDPVWHNQVLLLEIEPGLSLADLEKSVRRIAAVHPLIRSRLDLQDRRWRADATPSEAMASELQAVDPRDLDREVRRIGEALQSSLDPTRGRSFLAQLIRSGGTQDLLLLVGHHAVFDAVSWRIVLDELFSNLEGRARAPSGAPAEVAKIDRWVVGGASRRAALQAAIRQYMLGAAPTAPPCDEAGGRPMGIERTARSTWLGLDCAQTRRLKAAAAAAEVHAGTFILAALFDAYRTLDGRDRLWIDIEGHGRVRSGSTTDVSSCIGWFTVATPINIWSGTPHETALASTSRALQAAAAEIQEIGVLREEIVEAGLAPPTVAFNFLGEWRLPLASRLKPSFSPIYAGLARGPDNARPYDLVVTGRILDGRVAIDITHRSEDGRMAEQLAAALHSALLSAIGAAPEQARLVDGANACGHLAHAPAALSAAARRETEHETYRSILLTGATGFVGIHLLRELLERTEARIHCLVRGPDVAKAEARLRDVFAWYHPTAAALAASSRIIVVNGDVGLSRLGLDAASYARLRDGLDAIYHCAADVRLLAPTAILGPTNVEGTRRLLALAAAAGHIDFHHVSTLAVAGLGDGESVFDELSFDIGQEFRNSYEATKYAAEQQVRQYGLSGARATIYRMGNVAAHSVSGRFQRNAGQNQFVQLLRAVVRLNELPGAEARQMVLSPVDIVAAGIAALSLRSEPSRTFHVESPFEVPMLQILQLLNGEGRPLSLRPSATLRDLFVDRSDVADPDLDLAAFWVNRPRQRGTFGQARTLSLLNDLGVVFPEPTTQWLAAFIAELRAGEVFRTVPLGVAHMATTVADHGERM